eukprot:1637143-Prymnesium_polylepis.1
MATSGAPGQTLSIAWMNATPASAPTRRKWRRPSSPTPPLREPKPVREGRPSPSSSTNASSACTPGWMRPVWTWRS